MSVSVGGPHVTPSAQSETVRTALHALVGLAVAAAGGSGPP